MFNEKHTALRDRSSICGVTWQGDFGKGVETGSGVYDQLGANPCSLYPAPVTGVSSSIPAPQFKLGTIITGTSGTEFILCRLVLAATTDLIPGDVYQIDENFAASALITSGVVLNLSCGICNIFAPATVAATYYIWLARKGNVIVHAGASSLATGGAESTAVGGVVKLITGNHTGSTMTVGGLSAYGASSNITFKANSATSSPVLTNVSSQISINGVVGGITDLCPGMTFTGTDAPSNACIANIRQTGTTWAIDIGTATAGNQTVANNASGNSTATTYTVTTHVQGLANYPTQTTQN